MKRRHRRQDGTDSLDMLLDALCNMFGGIIFIALLVVIMGSGDVAAKAGKTESQTDESESELMAMEQLKQLDAQMEDREWNPRELEDLQDQFDRLDESMKALERAKELAGEEQEEASPIDMALRDRLDEIERLEGELKKLEALEKHPDTSEEIDKEQREIEDLQKQLEDARERREVDARLPKKGIQSGLSRVWICLDGSKAYDLGPGDEKAESNRDVIISDFKDEDGRDCYTWDFRPGGGFRVTDKVARHERFIELVKTYPSEKYMIRFMVEPDAHESFNHLKIAFMEEGYKYNLRYPPAPALCFTYDPVDTASD